MVICRCVKIFNPVGYNHPPVIDIGDVIEGALWAYTFLDLCGLSKDGEDEPAHFRDILTINRQREYLLELFPVLDFGSDVIGHSHPSCANKIQNLVANAATRFSSALAVEIKVGRKLQIKSPTIHFKKIIKVC